MTETFDIVIIGAGMAGASIAAELGGYARVLVAEAEPVPGYHTTGRSAAFWEKCYGGPGITPLTLASESYLEQLGVLTQRTALYIAPASAKAEADAFERGFNALGAQLVHCDRADIERAVPGIKPGWDIGLVEPSCRDIDVASLHHHYLGAAKQKAIRLLTKARLERATRDGDGWELSFGAAGIVRAGVVVNAAGAWADQVADICGAPKLGITPLRRTVVQLRTNPAPQRDLPLVLDLAGGFYFKPDGNRLWLSPHDETPSLPCDAAPEELDVAIAIDRLQQVVDWKIEAVERKWAGLRSFTRDRLPVYGYDDAVPGFFWFAGQGGFGIQTAPAAARLGAQLLLEQPRDAMTSGLDAARYSPLRFG